MKKYTYARKEGDVYVMDTTFHVRVYDLNLVPAIRMYSDPECTQEIKMGQIGALKRLLSMRRMNLNTERVFM